MSSELAENKRAALAAAARVIGMVHAPGWTPAERAQHTLTMAYDFLRWLESDRLQFGEPAPVDERLTPGVDFRSPSMEATQPLKVLHFGGSRPRHRQDTGNGRWQDGTGVPPCVCGRAWPCNREGKELPHELSPVLLTPSGRRACHCGQSWPCSLRAEAREEAMQ